jgi:hypothetical protein
MRAKDGLGGIEAPSRENLAVATTTTMSFVAAVAEVIETMLRPPIAESPATHNPEDRLIAASSSTRMIRIGQEYIGEYALHKCPSASACAS